MSAHLPRNPNLEHLKKQAKRLLKAIQAGDPEAKSRVDVYAIRGDQSAQISLRDVHETLAKEYGFNSWQDLSKWVTAPNEADSGRHLDTAEIESILKANSGRGSGSFECGAVILARFNYAIGLMVSGDKEEAMAQFQECERIADNHSAASKLRIPVSCLIWPGQMEMLFKATEGLSSLEELRGHIVDAYYVYAIALKLSGNMAAAIEQLRTCEELTANGWLWPSQRTEISVRSLLKELLP